MRKTAMFVLVLLLCVAVPFMSSAANGRVYKSASEFDYPPFSVTTSGEADGFSVELLKAVAEEMGIDISFKVDQWSVIKQELKDGDLDILPLVGYTQEREEYFDFTVPYIVMSGRVFVRSDNKSIKSEDDLISKEIIVVEGDTAHEYAVQNAFSDQLITTSTYKEAFVLLSNGEHDAVLAPSIVGQKMINDLHLNNIIAATHNDHEDIVQKKINLSGFEQKLCFAVKEEDKELLAELNEGLAIVSENGTYNELYAKWFPFMVESQLSTKDILLYHIGFFIALIILLLIVFIIIVKRQVKKKSIALDLVNEKNLIIKTRLIDQQKLESIGTLASGVAHEINNPINGIMNYGQLILDSAPSRDIEEYADEIIHEAERVSIIVKNLFQFSRREKQSFATANIDDIIERTVSLIKPVIAQDQIVLQVDIKKDLPKIKCRSQQIQLVLMNLLTNARDALNDENNGQHPDKVIKLTCEIKSQDGQDWICIVVEDNGTGIREDIQKSIFDPFFTTKGRDEGTGLGLAISYGIVKEHNGELTFETKEGEYTRFNLSLPVH